MGLAATSFKIPGVLAKTDSDQGFRLGLASYTLRKFNLDDCITLTKRVGLSHICLKSFHLPLESTQDQLRAAAAKVKAAGLDLYGCGVVYMKNEDEVNQAFSYAKSAGMRMIVGVPEHHLLTLVETKVKEFDISVVIHNHGPGDERYPSPQSVVERIKGLDKRIGLCMDIGHSQRIGLDPSADIEKYADRLMDVHVKDVTESTADGKNIEIGHGVIDIPKVLRTLNKVNYTGIVAFEYEKDPEDPLAGLAESVGFVRGVVAADRS